MANAPMPFGAERRAALRARRIVVKLGTAVLTGEDGDVAPERVHALVASLVALQRVGREVLLVTSGAVRLGAERLAASADPSLRLAAQACAAVGQHRLMACYAQACERLGVAAAQLLLTGEDLARPARMLGLRATLTQLLELGVLPVINENDAVTPERGWGRRGRRGEAGFGDNDRLAALLATRIGADLLLILTDVAGLYTADPRDRAGARLIRVVRRVTPRMERSAGGPRVGRGGEAVGTLFLPGRVAERRRA
jgi:glutamate 5-kinase